MFGEESWPYSKERRSVSRRKVLPWSSSRHANALRLLKHFWQKNIMSDQAHFTFLDVWCPITVMNWTTTFTKFYGCRLLSVGLFEIKGLCQQAKEPRRTCEERESSHVLPVTLLKTMENAAKRALLAMRSFKRWCTQIFLSHNKWLLKWTAKNLFFFCNDWKKSTFRWIWPTWNYEKILKFGRIMAKKQSAVV